MTEEEKPIAWQKVSDLVKVRENARIKPSPYLEVRLGARRTSFRINFRQGGVVLRKVIAGKFEKLDDWEKATREVDRMIGIARFGEKQTPKDMMRSEEICHQLLGESKDQDERTVTGKKYIYEKYMIPWLNEFCPYAADVNISTWPRYKTWLRASNPTRALENHAKYFRTFQNRIFDLGIIKQKIRLSFDVKKEDFRKPGLVIPDETLSKMLETASKLKNRAWYIRILLGRYTGLRPTEARDLRKKSVPHPKDPDALLPPNIEFIRKSEIEILMIRIYPEDNKEHRYREFEVRLPKILKAIRAQIEIERLQSSPYVFPMIEDLNRPAAKYLGKPNIAGTWHWIVHSAGGKEFTPHDLRHTYATEMFKATNQWAQLCYQLDMSLETAQQVYIHLKADDTVDLAETVAKRIKT